MLFLRRIPLLSKLFCHYHYSLLSLVASYLARSARVHGLAELTRVRRVLSAGLVVLARLAGFARLALLRLML